MDIKLFNTATKKVATFKAEKNVTMYSCGPTVYNYAHLGNLRAYIFVDLLLRTLFYFGKQTNHIINITDVGHLTNDADDGEDKIEMSAKKENKSAEEIANFYTKSFKEDLAALNIHFLKSKNTKWIKATDTIPEQISLIETLADHGFTYKTSDGIYFDTSKYPDYPKFAKLDMANLKAGARVSFNKEKKNVADFALWKFSPKGLQRQMEWDSPWGVGFPGWHTECVAIILKELTKSYSKNRIDIAGFSPIDIHTGGIDHINTHHTNEIAQISSLTNKPLAIFWLHNEHLLIESSRMGKSKGNIVTLKSITKDGYNPLAYKYLILSGHYRSVLNFSIKELRSASSGYDNLLGHIKEVAGKSGNGCKEFENKFFKALANDLNSPQAIATMWDMLRSNCAKEDKAASIIKFDEILGLNLTTYLHIKVPKKVLALTKKREQARQNKNWDASDKLRKEIEALGYNLKDTVKGPVVTPK
ncbi:MAG: cysteine--tRNA ligase [bacterium]